MGLVVAIEVAHGCAPLGHWDHGVLPTPRIVEGAPKRRGGGQKQVSPGRVEAWRSQRVKRTSSSTSDSWRWK